MYRKLVKANIFALFAVLMTVAPLRAERSDLRERLGSRFSTHATERFVVVHATSKAWAVEVGDLLERTHERFYETLGEAGFVLSRPADPLVCIWFASRDAFDRYARGVDQTDMSWSDGYYSAKTNRVALFHQDGPMISPPDHPAENQEIQLAGASQVVHQHAEPDERRHSVGYLIDIAKTTHEAAHQLAFNSGLQQRGVTYPLWASEGLATNFEAGPDGHLGPERDNAVRRRRLVRAWKREGLLPLSRLITLTDVATHPPRSPRVLYAEVWGFFRFLFLRRSAALADYYRALADKQPGWRPNRVMRREFTRAFGSMDELEKEWKRFLAGLPADRGDEPERES